MRDEDVEGFLAISREVFAPLYPYYAGKFVAQSGLTGGVCLDLGCGGGDLGLAVTEEGAFAAILYDKLPVMAAAARDNAARRGLADRVRVVAGDVGALPLGDGCVDLVVSRGSVMFWDDLPRAFREIWRVLAPGGHVWLGGGLGSPAMREAICRQMAGRHPAWAKGTPPPPRPGTDPDTHAQMLRAAGIDRFSIEAEETGHWIRFGK